MPVLSRPQEILNRRATVEEGGVDSKGLKYVIAAVVVPVGLVLLAVLLCVYRSRKKGKKARLAAENEKQMKENRASAVKISSTFRRNKNGASNIEIKVIPQDLDEGSQRKNMILYDIEKNGNLAEELRSNQYFNNYGDITKRDQAANYASWNEIQLVLSDDEKRQSEEIEIVVPSDMEEVNIADNSPKSYQSYANRKYKRKAPIYLVVMENQGQTGENVNESRESLAGNDEFYTPTEGSPHDSIDSKKPVEGVEKNVTNMESKNTQLHRDLIQKQRQFIHDFDEQEEAEEDISEIPIIPGAMRRRFSNDDKSLNHSLTKASHLTDDSSKTVKDSIVTRSTEPTTISGKLLVHNDSLNRKSISPDNIAATFFPPQVIDNPDNYADITRPSEVERSASIKKLQDELIERNRSLGSKVPLRDSFLDRNLSSSDLQKTNLYSTGDEDYDYESKPNDYVRLSINLDTEHYSSDSSKKKSNLSKLQEVDETSPQINARVSFSKLDEADTRTFMVEGKNDSVETSKRNSLMDGHLTDTINDINKFLRENGVYTSPVLIDTGNVVLGGLVITNNLSRESINEHLSQKNINVLKDSTKDSPGGIYSAKVDTPVVDSPSSSNYDMVRRSMQSSGSKLSPLFSNKSVASPHFKSPLAISPPVVSPSIQSPDYKSPSLKNQSSIAAILHNESSNPISSPSSQAKFFVVNSPTIPKRSSKRSNPNLNKQYLQGLNSPINAPVLAHKSSRNTVRSSSSKGSRQLSNVRSSRALGINLKPQLSLEEEAMLTNRTPDQIVKDRFYDSEESYNYVFDDEGKPAPPHPKVTSPHNFVSPYANIV